MKSKNRTTKEKAWHNTVAQYARESAWLNRKFGGHVADPYQFHIDHILGAMTKRKIDLVSVKVGEWAVLPVPIQLHCITKNDSYHKSQSPKSFKEKFGCQKIMWRDFVLEIRECGIELPFGDDVIKAIVEG